MSLPKEGSRDVDDGIIVSVAPDICLTPAGGGMVPIPYTIWCRQADAANLASSVRQTDERSHALSSIVLQCYGDEPGTGGGIRSGTTGAECTPKTWSDSVRAEDRNMVRHDDQWWMNHRNTHGKLIYKKDTNIYKIQQSSQIIPQIHTMANPSGSQSVLISQPRQLAQADAAAGPYCENPIITIPPPIMGQPILSPNLSKHLTGPLLDYVQKRLGEVRVTRAPGNCTPDQHDDLQNRVENACGAAKACRGGDSTSVITAKLAAHYECIRARQKINKTCFNGGNPGHKTAIAQRYDAIGNCIGLY